MLTYHAADEHSDSHARNSLQGPVNELGLQNAPVQKAYNKIMVVDDEPDIATVLHMGLENAGFVVTTYTDPRKALPNYKPGRYDLVLLDVRMPGLNGYQLYRELKSREKEEEKNGGEKEEKGKRNGLKAIFVTAYDVKQEATQLFPELTDDCIIVKPVEISALIKVIHRRLAAAELSLAVC